MVCYQGSRGFGRELTEQQQDQAAATGVDGWS